MTDPTTYAPQDGVFPGRPPCAACGADFHLHRPPDAGPLRVTGRGLGKRHDAGGALRCPTAYRPDTLGTAVAAMADAATRHDPAGVFAARGDIQRLLGRGHQWDGCIGCRALKGDDA